MFLKTKLLNARTVKYLLYTMKILKATYARTAIFGWIKSVATLNVAIVEIGRIVLCQMKTNGDGYAMKRKGSSFLGRATVNQAVLSPSAGTAFRCAPVSPKPRYYESSDELPGI